ncbi:unnamed protein product, partial [Meganyctiphanes norvegica]
MQAKKRYFLIFSCCAFLSFGYLGYHWKSNNEDNWYVNLSSYLDSYDIVKDEDISASPSHRSNLESTSRFSIKECSMETCFDLSRCDKDFRVYVYPIDDNVPPSISYMKVLSVIQESNYYTSDPNKACVFVLSLDTLDRDTLSKDYVRNMPPRVHRLALWNDGQNHIIFNLYSGTWPDYTEDLGFDVEKAILAKASISIENFRSGFDISLPLFHKTHPEKGGENGFLAANAFPGTKKYLLAFKGKRYVYGIGSETRNSLYHLHNKRDIVLVTTCKHGGSWKEHKDERCDFDNMQYDKYDYEVLLRNSTFCLVPRGRRLGSFRFLEVLQAGCIPVLLANGWELPFSEVINWGQAAIWADERLLLQVPDMLRSINSSQILWMRQQSQVLWNQYFSSVEKIIHSTLEIVKERVVEHLARPLSVWNSIPGGLVVNLSFSDHLAHFPFYNDKLGVEPSNRYATVIVIRSNSNGHRSMCRKAKKNPCHKYVAMIALTSLLAKSTPGSSHLSDVLEISGLVLIASSTAELPATSTEGVSNLDFDVMFSAPDLRAFLIRTIGHSECLFTKQPRMYFSAVNNSYSLSFTSPEMHNNGSFSQQELYEERAELEKYYSTLPRYLVWNFIGEASARCRLASDAACSSSEGYICSDEGAKEHLRTPICLGKNVSILRDLSRLPLYLTLPCLHPVL